MMFVWGVQWVKQEISCPYFYKTLIQDLRLRLTVFVTCLSMVQTVGVQSHV